MSKLCEGQKETIVKTMVAVLEKVKPDEIDEIVASAKARLKEGSKQAKRKNLEKLFDQQIQTLKDRGCLEAIVGMLREQRNQVITKASEMTFGKKNISFLPVTPRICMTIYSQMPMVRNKDKVGYNFLDPAEITDVIETSTKPYYIYDIEDGEEMLGKSSKDAEKLIKKQNRRCLTDVEVIALGIHTDVLQRHYVDATGSRYESSDRVPTLCLDGGRPRLDWDYADDADDEWGSASCGSN